MNRVEALVEALVNRVEALEDNELDAAVALALGWHVEGSSWYGSTNPDDGTANRNHHQIRTGVDLFHPSRSWAQGGPIIESECILLQPCETSTSGRWWEAQPAFDKWKGVLGRDATPILRGPTPLVAAMRAFVASCVPPVPVRETLRS